MLKVVRDFARSHIYIGIAIFLASLISLGLIFNSNINSAHAANPQSVDYNVYIKPTLSIKASTNDVVINLNPNFKQFGTANLDVTVGTNNQYGYKLFMNTDANETSLKRDDTIDGITTNATIPTLSASTTASTFPDNQWGYRINNNVGGDSSLIDTTASNFYPYTPTPNPPLISSAAEATNEQTANLTFGAKIDYTKPAGSYDLTLKFNALPTVTTYYMQDIAADPTLANTVCTEEPTVVIDKRDEKSYTIRRINGDCWMVENLQFTGTTMDSTTSNISPEYTPSSPYRVNGGNGYGELDTGDVSGSSYTEPKIHSGKINITNTPISSSVPSAEVDTVWYNYAAASAETITGESNTDPQLYDICPAGWKLPNDAEFTNIIDYQEQFNLVEGGSYVEGVMTSTASARWWSSNYMDIPTGRSKLTYVAGVLSITRHSRPGGFYVRCIMKNADINNLTFMQDFARAAESDTATGDNKKQQIVDSMELNSPTGYTLKDIRDSNEYTINKIGPENDVAKQNIWMTKNLLFQGTTLNVTDTDVTTTRYINGSNVKAYYNLATQSSTTTDYCRDDYTGNSPGYINACTYYTTSDSNIGNMPNAWYNYAAASAGTITGTSNSATATESICPKGWAMPDQSQVESIGNNTSTYIPIFKPVGGGFYDNSVPSLLDRGYYWSRVILDSGVNRYYLGYYSAEPAYLGTWGSTRAGGRYVRCVAR